MNRRILILCTGNSCRSQMAEGILKSVDPELAVFSAGTQPANEIHPMAITAMREIGIDIRNQVPENVSKYVNQSFDFVITVCDNAKETCPVFYGKVNQKLHLGFVDQADAIGTETEILQAFRTVRDEIGERFKKFYQSIN